MDDRILMITLRLVHILSGVFWVGAALLLNIFIAPVLRTIGPEAGRFMHQLMVVRRLATWLAVAAALAVLSGLAMYLRISMLTDGAFARAPQGLVLGAGAVAAILGGMVGSMVGGAAARRMAEIGATLRDAPGGAPPPAVAAEMRRLQRRATWGGRVSVTLLVLATASMAAARYL